jgi:hypothetical protein
MLHQRLASLDEGGKAIAICDTTRLVSASRRKEPVKYRITDVAEAIAPSASVRWLAFA